ncbi:hypothetical protein [Streptomyces bambusae]|uniref:Uncharacterized protein n=1 Tax=Streptomyces bambusae TaxID=1550616 RepID=A0ABS6ZF12_9ACTN|nr:hypothetical protein [Streptomyces bambusae]MBW5486352.1 hypothetical protein [Streptomyces bambusae]
MSAAGAFEPATGDGPTPAAPNGPNGPNGPDRPDGRPGSGGARAAEVRTAYEGLLQIRRLVNGAAGETVPAPWERQQPERAVALALKAAGLPPSAVDPATGARTAMGYVVGPGEAPGQVRVAWAGPPGGGTAGQEQERLTACAGVLGQLGWECLLYRGPKHRRYLEVEPPR